MSDKNWNVSTRKKKFQYKKSEVKIEKEQYKNKYEALGWNTKNTIYDDAKKGCILFNEYPSVVS